MAGMLPGVGVAPRRRSQHYLRREDNLNHREPPLFRERLQPSMDSMDETALRARQRLEHKLGCFRSSSRLSKPEPSEGRSCSKQTEDKQNSGLESKILGKLAWHIQLNYCISHTKL